MVPKGTSTSQPVAPRVGSSCSVSLACEAGPFLGVGKLLTGNFMFVGSRRANVFPQEVLGALVKVKDIWGQSAHFFSLKTFRKHNELAVLLHSKRAGGTGCQGETRRDGLAPEGEVPQTQRER